MLVLLEQILLGWPKRKKKKGGVQGARRCLSGWSCLLASQLWPSLGYGLCKCYFYLSLAVKTSYLIYVTQTLMSSCLQVVFYVKDDTSIFLSMKVKQTFSTLETCNFLIFNHKIISDTYSVIHRIYYKCYQSQTKHHPLSRFMMCCNILHNRNT